MTNPAANAATTTAPSITTREATPADAPAIGQLHAAVFGPGRFARSAYRVREGTNFASPFCRVAVDGDRIIASLRLPPVSVGGTSGALLLGPLAVDPAFANQGFGRRISPKASRKQRKPASSWSCWSAISHTMDA